MKILRTAPATPGLLIIMAEEQDCYWSYKQEKATVLRLPLPDISVDRTGFFCRSVVRDLRDI